MGSCAQLDTSLVPIRCLHQYWASFRVLILAFNADFEIRPQGEIS